MHVSVLNSIKNFFKNRTSSKLSLSSLNTQHSFYYSLININSDSIDPTLKIKILNLLYKHLSIIHKINTQDIDEQQIIYLKEDTPSEVNQILSTFGYVNNKVKVIVNKKIKVLKIDIDLDKRVIVDSYFIKVTGPINKDLEYNKYIIKTINDNWILTKGKAFNQDDWEKSKLTALIAIKKNKYPLAKITKSEAQLNIVNYKADLQLEIESGNLIKFGNIEIEGLKRYPKDVVTGLATFKIDEDYNFDKFFNLQKSLGYDSHFENTVATPDFTNTKDDKVPIKVVVEELPKNKLDIGIGHDSIEGIGTYLGYAYFNLFNKGYVSSIASNNNKYEQSFSMGISQPMRQGNNYYTSNANLANKKRRNVNSKQFSIGVWKVYINKNWEYRIGLEYFLENSKIQDSYSLGRSYITMFTSSIKYNNIYPKLKPENGIYIFGNIGATLGKLLSISSMQKYSLDAAYYFTPYKHKKIGTFVFRSTLGYIYIFTDKNAILEKNIPTDVLFKTGGPSSVRGYEIDSIGIVGPNGSTLGGRALLVLSSEYQLPINDSFSFAVFHDVGDVKNKFSDFKLYHSTGIGIRWFNILAPVSFDVAYKHKSNLTQKHKNIGWYITLGAHF